VLITGGSSGIGEQMAKDFVRKGASKVIIAARRVAEMERVKRECERPEAV
jgi:NADP-dependent 3-hydroxy acid dehydrogenase YdfG